MNRRRWRSPKRTGGPEYQESEDLCLYVQTLHPEIWPVVYHVPNERSNAVEAKRLSAIGVKPGVPDFVFPVARCGFHGLYLELKATGATPSDVRETQSGFCERLQREGYAAIAALGLDSAIRVIDAYFLGTREEWDQAFPPGTLIVRDKEKNRLGRVQ